MGQAKDEDALNTLKTDINREAAMNSSEAIHDKEILAYPVTYKEEQNKYCIIAVYGFVISHLTNATSPE